MQPHRCTPSLTLYSSLSFRYCGLVVWPEKPCEGAARFLNVLHEELMGLFVVIAWPGTHIPIVDVPRLDLRIDQLVSLPGGLGPILAISSSAHVLKVQSLVAELAGNEICV